MNCCSDCALIPRYSLEIAARDWQHLIGWELPILERVVAVQWDAMVSPTDGSKPGCHDLHQFAMTYDRYLLFSVLCWCYLNNEAGVFSPVVDVGCTESVPLRCRMERKLLSIQLVLHFHHINLSKGTSGLIQFGVSTVTGAASLEWCLRLASNCHKGSDSGVCLRIYFKSLFHQEHTSRKQKKPRTWQTYKVSKNTTYVLRANHWARLLGPV